MFKSLYNYFKSRKLVLLFISLSIFSASLFFALKIKPVEDISKMIPVDEELERFNEANKHIKFNERIIVRIFLKDSTRQAPDELVQFSDTLIDYIKVNSAEHISEIKHTVSENMMNEVYEIFYQNLPVFLNEEDYLKIDSLLIESEIDKTLEADFKTLISPTGLVTKKYIKKDPLNLTPIVLKKLQSLQFDDNYDIYDSHILTKDQRSLFVFIRSNYSNDETGKNKQLVDGINLSVNKIKGNYPTIDVEIFGAPVISTGNAERIKLDIILTVSIALIVLFIFLSIFFRRIEVFFVIFLPAAFGAAFSIAVIYLLQAEVSAISLGVGSILVGISIDYSLHIFTHFRSKTNASEIFNDISVPILMSSLTTASAFFCLLFVSSEALHDLGLFAGISVIAAALFALIVLPHFLRKGKTNIEKQKVEYNFLERFASYSFHKNKYLIFILLTFTAVGLFLFNKAEFENDMDKMNYMSPDLKKAEQNLDKISSDALRKMYFVVTGDTPEQAFIQNDLLAEKINTLKGQNIIQQYSSVNFFLVSDSLQRLRIQKWESFWTEEKVDKLSDDLNNYGNVYGFKENSFIDFIQNLKAKKAVTTKETNEKLIALFGNDLITQGDVTSIVTLIKLEQKNKELVYNTVKANKNIYVLDKKYITDKIVEILKTDFDLLVVISLSVVFIILLLYFGRIELTLITIIPMLISWVWTLSVMYLFDFKFTIFNIIISTFIFGLGIDYSIFISRGLIQKYRFGSKTLSSYKTSVLLSAITTITAIGVLIFAKHPALKSIAFLSVIGISSVIFVTYTLQPLLFNFLIKQQGKKRSLPVTFKDLFFALLIILIFIAGSLLSILLWLFLLILPVRKDFKKHIFHYSLWITSKMIAYIPINVKKIINNPFQEQFKKPAIIIANHQSHIDIPLILMLHPKLLILTNDWVQNNIFYGKIVKFADFYSTSDGFEKNLERLKKQIKKGYSVLIYPEGSRSEDSEIKRFHKGAFEYAAELNVDILPIIIQGASDCIPKGEPFLKSGQISVNILKRISVKDYGETGREQAKNIRKFMADEYEIIRKTYETPAYFRRKLLANYIYKNPILEHYTRIKTRLEKNYELFDKILPTKGQFTDIGTGYGYLPYMLSFCSSDRMITGIDYDCNKIHTANHNISKTDQLDFICGDANEIEFKKSDAFILNDVLHYMPKDKQKDLIVKCINHLNPDGMIIIRDGNSEMQKKHKGTKLTEFFSTKLLKFNKTEYKRLHFTSKQEVLDIVTEYEFSVEIIDETKFTSNITFILKNKVN